MYGPAKMTSSMAVNQAAQRFRISSARSATHAAPYVQRRGLAGAADHDGPQKVAFWKDPMTPSRWKEEHFVILSLSGWGLLFYSGYKFLTKGKKKEEKLANA